MRGGGTDGGERSSWECAEENCYFGRVLSACTDGVQGDTEASEPRLYCVSYGGINYNNSERPLAVTEYVDGSVMLSTLCLLRWDTLMPYC